MRRTPRGDSCGRLQDVKVLLATDGLPAAEAAERLIVRTARRDLNLAVATAAGVGGEGKDAAREVVRDAVARLEEAGFRPTGHLPEGDTDDALSRLVAEENIDLVVLGTGNKSWLGRILFGSISTQMLHSSSSVLLVNEAPPSDHTKTPVLIAVDESPEGAAAVEAAAGLLDPERSSIRLFSVVAVRVPAFAGGPVTGFASPGFDDRLEAELTEERRRHIEHMAGGLREAGFDTDARVTLGAPVKRILEEARDTGASLLVVGARRRGAMDRALVGSVSDQVVRYAPAALIVRPDIRRDG